MARIWRSAAIYGLFLVLIASCGKRPEFTADADQEKDKSKKDEDRACGKGLPCDPDNLGNYTCTSLGLGPGSLSCDPKTCHLVLTKCANNRGPTTTGNNGGTGTGSGGSPGVFGDVTGMGPAPTAPVGDGGVAFFGGLFGDGGFFGGNFPGGQAMPGGGNNGNGSGGNNGNGDDNDAGK